MLYISGKLEPPERKKSQCYKYMFLCAPLLHLLIALSFCHSCYHSSLSTQFPLNRLPPANKRNVHLQARTDSGFPSIFLVTGTVGLNKIYFFSSAVDHIQKSFNNTKQQLGKETYTSKNYAKLIKRIICKNAHLPTPPPSNPELIVCRS